MESQMTWWIGFHIFVFAMLALDLGVFHKKNHEVSVKESLVWTGVWISLALFFNYGVYHFIGEREAYEFLTAYVLEKSLSVDNIFVMTLIFTYFKVEQKYQHRVLFWGILGALVMRILFIVGGVALIEKFHFILYFFGAFLIYTGGKMLLAGGDSEHNPEEGFIYKLAKKRFRMTEGFHEEKFFIIEKGVRHMTPLFLVLLIIESTDLIFAVDSIPAIFAIAPDDPFILYTSNIFAILGLRSLYFLLSNFIHMFSRLKFGLAIILSFIGFKMIIAPFYHISSPLSLSVVGGILILSVAASILFPIKESAK